MRLLKITEEIIRLHAENHVLNLQIENLRETYDEVKHQLDVVSGTIPVDSRTPEDERIYQMHAVTVMRDVDAVTAERLRAFRRVIGYVFSRLGAGAGGAKLGEEILEKFPETLEGMALRHTNNHPIEPPAG